MTPANETTVTSARRLRWLDRVAPDAFSRALLGTVAAVLFVGAVGVVPAVRAASGPTSAYSGTDLNTDAAMTQRMSLSTASGPMQQYSTKDPQLAHATNPGFVGALEQYVAQQRRMIGLADGDGR